MAQRKHHRSDPSEGGWDPSIVKAPASHKAKSKKSHRKHRSRRRRHKALKTLGIVVGVVVAILLVAGIALALYARSLDDAMSVDDAQLDAALTESSLDTSFYVLVMGIDLREYTLNSTGVSTQEQADAQNAAASESGTLSDVMMLVRVDAMNSKVTMLSIPRDTPVKDDQGKTVKINNAYLTGGASNAVKAVEDLTGVTISHYVEVTGTGLEQLVDSAGGITVDIPVAIHASTITHERVDLEPGLQHVNGAEALALANVRMVYEGDQEYNRQVGARQVAAGLINAIKSQPVLELPGVVSQAASCVKTDMKTSELVQLAGFMGSRVKVLSGTGPYAGDLDYWVDYPDHLYEGAPWLCYVNEDGWTRVLETVAAGDDPGQMSYADDLVHFADQPEDTWSQGLVVPEELRAEG